MASKKKKLEDELIDQVINGTFKTERQKRMEKRDTNLRKQQAEADIAPVKKEVNIPAPGGRGKDENVFSRAWDAVKGVGGNFFMGVEGTIPKATEFVTEASKYATKKASSFVIDKILGIAGVDEEKAEVASKVLGGFVGNTAVEISPIGQTNRELNSEEKQQWRQETIQANTENAQKAGKVGEWFNDLAMGVGDNAITTALFFIPGGQIPSVALSVTSAGGSYMQDAEQRGMNEDEKMAYATTMALWEGGGDALQNFALGGMFKLAGKGEVFTKKFAQSVLGNVALNAGQEGITEPVQELTADIVGDYGDWENMPERIAWSASIGGAQALLMGGAGAGINSAIYTVNVNNNTAQAIKTAEQQLGRELNAEEVIQIENQVKEAVKAKMIDTTDMTDEEKAEIERLAGLSTEDMVLEVTKQVADSGKVDTEKILSGVKEAIEEQTKAPVQVSDQVSDQVAPDPQVIEAQIEQKVEELEKAEDPRVKEIIRDEIEVMQEELPRTDLTQNPKAIDPSMAEAQSLEGSKTLTEENMPPVAEDTTPDTTEEVEKPKPISPLAEKDMGEIGKRSVKAYTEENPDAKPYFKEEAQNMLYDLDNTVKGEKIVTKVYNPYTGLYENAEYTGTKRQTAEAIAYLKDNYNYTYAEIRKGLEEVINGNAKTAVAKRIEVLLDERMREGYTTADGVNIPVNENYIKFLEEQQHNKQATEDAEAITDIDAPIDDSKYITVAPYTNTNVTNKNFNEVKDAVEEKFIGEANKISALFGIKIENISTNVGGFTFQEGDLAGKSVKELSYTFELKTENIEDADLIASLMGDLAHEQQEAVISANYLDASSTNADALEFRVGIKNTKGVYKALKKAGISDYTIDKTNNTIKILEFDLDNTNIVDTLKTLATELGGNFNGIEESKIESRYLDTEGRRSLYTNWLTTHEINEQNRELSSYVEQALQKLGGETDSTSEINENGEINDKTTVDNKDVAPTEKESQKAISEEIDTLVNEEIDTSFMREETIKKLENYQKQRQQLNEDRRQSYRDFDTEIRKKTAEYEALQNKNTKKANNLLQQLSNLEARRENIQDEYVRRIGNVTAKIDNMKTKKFEQTERKATQDELRRKEFEKTGITRENLDFAKDLSKPMLHNTDPIRLQEMTFGRETGGKVNKTIFQPVKDHTSDKIRFQNKERNEIKELGIKPKSKESSAVQKYGEKKYVDENGKEHKYGDAELKAEFPNVEDQEKIKHASQVIRQKYDTYIDMANKAITKYGYDPIPKRQDYMRHFQELNDVFSTYGLPFNMQSAQANDLPTDINGLTADLKPGKNWFANALRRKGNKTAYDAITGIDGYIEGIGNLIYHTDDIQKLRGFENYVREMYGQEHGFDNLDNLSEAEKAIRIQQIQDNHLGNYVAWLREYTNNLAGKKAMADRAVEDIFGRKIYSFLNELKSQVGSNMTGLNLGSALTNPISMTQALAKTSKLATAKGYADTIKNIFIKDNFIEQNNFLTSRFGSDILAPTAWQKMRNAGQIFMAGTDWFSANAITRSKFYELKAQGLSDAEAHAEAGKFASRILGDRSQGATPTLYNSKMLGLVTQFQLEVNNQIYSMFGDTIADAKETSKKDGVLKATAGATFVLGQLAMYQWTFNNFYEGLTGRRPALDIIAVIATALGVGGDDEEEEKPLGDRLYEAIDMLMDGIPYVNVLTGGGRIPINDALPIKELYSGEDEFGNDKSRLKTLGEALPYYFLPTGYSQIKKTTAGLGMYDEDLPVAGSYTDSGNLRFTVEDDPMSVLQAGIFGQWSSKSAQDYIDSDFETIDKSNVEELVEAGFNSTDYVEYRKGLNEIKKMELEDGESRVTYIHDYIDGLDVTDEQKNVLYKHASSDKEQEKFEELDMSLDQIGSYFEAKATISQQVAEYLDSKDSLTLDEESDQYKEIVGQLNNDKKAVVIDAVRQANLTDDQKKYLYTKYYSSEKTIDKILDKGTSMDTYLQFEKDTLEFKADKDEDGDTISGSKGNKYEEYLLNSSMSNEDKQTLYEYGALSSFDDEDKHTTYKALKQVGVDINSYLSYASQTFTADKDSNGKTISGSRRKKIIKYVNSLENLTIPQKAMIIRSEYSTYRDYNNRIVKYVNGLDLTVAEKTKILEEFDFIVKGKKVSWE